LYGNESGGNEMTRIELTRHAAADPASVALLLAEPPLAAADGADDALPTGEVSLVRRNGVGFAAGVDVVVGEGRRALGRLTVVPSTDAGCDVRIELNPLDTAARELAEVWAAGFLDSLAERARDRSSAA
jgi:hypothetical protein